MFSNLYLTEMFFINFLSLLDHFQAIKKNVIEPLMASGGYPDLSGWTTKKNMCFFPNMQKKTTFSTIFVLNIDFIYYCIYLGNLRTIILLF